MKNILLLFLLVSLFRPCWSQTNIVPTVFGCASSNGAINQYNVACTMGQVFYSSLNQISNGQCRLGYPYDVTYLVVAPLLVEFQQAAVNASTIAVNSNTTWKTTATANWLSVSPSKATGSGILTITATANPTIAKRKATITVTAGSLTDSITVTQVAGDATLTVSTTSYNVPKDESKTSFAITSNATCSVKSSADWLTNKGTGLNVELSAAANMTSASRTAKLTISTTSGSPTKTDTITVTQAAGNATLVVDLTKSISSSATTTTCIDFSSNASWTASAASNNWLTISPITGSGDGSLSLTATTNSAVEARSATFTIKAKGEIDSVLKTITVTQKAAAPTLVLAKKAINLAKVTDTAKVSITSNTSWTAISSAPTWLTVSQSEATGNGKLTFTAQTNTTIKERTAMVFLQTTKGSPDVFDTIVVTQAKGDSTLTIEKDSLSIGKKANSRVAVKVNANFGFENDTMILPWFTRIITKDSLIFIATQVNPLTRNRDTSILVSIARIPNLIKVTQLNSDPYLQITPAILKLDSLAHDTTVLVSANVDWEISGNANWVSYTRKKNAQNDSIIFKIAANPTIASRSCELTITPAQGNAQTITITQAAGDTTLSLSQKGLVNNSLFVTVFANTSWNASSNVSWLTMNPQSGDDTTDLVFTVAKNNTVKVRKAIVTVASKTKSIQCTISQDAGDSVLRVQPDTLIAKSAANYSITVDANIKWTASKKADWLTLNAYTDSTKLDFSVLENNTIVPRVDTIVLRVGTLKETLIVKQAASDTTISLVETAKNISKTGETISLAVASNYAGWTVDGAKQWVVATKESNNESLKLVVAENETISERKDTIYLHAGTKQVSIVLTQAPGDERLSLNTDKAATTDTVLVTANTTWTVNESSDWLTVNTAGGTVTFTAVTNPTVKPRTANVEFTTAKATVTKTLVVTQAAGAATLSINKQQINFATAQKATDSIVIKSNTTPTITNGSSWIRASINDTLLCVTALENTASIARKDSFLLSVEGIDKKIIVTQAPAAVVLSTASTQLAFAANAKLATSFLINANAKIKVFSTSKSLLLSFDNKTFNDTITQDATNYRTQTIVVKADTNKLASVQTDSIIIVSGGEKKYIIVTQDAPIETIAATKQTLSIKEISPRFPFKNYFKYNGNASLTYEVSSSDISVANVIQIAQDFVFILNSAGTTTVTLSAKTPYGTTATQSFVLEATSTTKPNCTLSITTQITSINCFGASTGAVKVTARGGNAPYSYRWSTSSSDSVLKDLSAGKYSVVVLDSLGCAKSADVTLTENSKIRLQDSIITSPSCGGTNGMIAITPTGGTSPYQYKWSDASTNDSILNKKVGTYTVSITDALGCEVSKSFDLNNDWAPVITVNSVNRSSCKEANGSISITVSKGTPPYSYQWLDGPTTEDRVDLSPNLYALTVTDAMECKAILSQKVKALEMKQPQIALVTVGLKSQKNLIVWLHDKENTIENYLIYRNEIDGYKKIAMVSASDSSIYMDATVDPKEKSYRYKIAATNACGDTTKLSSAFKTMHFSATQSVINKKYNELRWDAYEGDTNQYCFILYRQINDQWFEIKKMSLLDFSFTDVNTEGTKNYFVAVQLKDTITPSMLKTDTGPFSQSFSNMSEASLVSEPEIAVVNHSAHLVVYPNPANDMLSIQLNNASIVGNVQILAFDAVSYSILPAATNNELHSISINHLASGVYTLAVPTDKGILYQKLVIIK